MDGRFYSLWRRNSNLKAPRSFPAGTNGTVFDILRRNTTSELPPPRSNPSMDVPSKPHASHLASSWLFAGIRRPCASGSRVPRGFKTSQSNRAEPVWKGIDRPMDWIRVPKRSSTNGSASDLPPRDTFKEPTITEDIRSICGGMDRVAQRIPILDPSPIESASTRGSIRIKRVRI